jgi:hypothetical protein
MDNKNLSIDDFRKIVSQIKKYKLDSCFKSEEEFEIWLEGLSSKHIENFNSIDVDFCGEIARAFLDYNLLDCDDYREKINEILKLKNVLGIGSYVSHLVSKAFLASRRFTTEINELSMAYKRIQRGIYHILEIIDNVDFIDSPYHDEDFNTILQVMMDKDGENRAVVLADVACNKNSINSGVHCFNMMMLKNCDSRCLRYKNSKVPQIGLNDLVTNPNSLSKPFYQDII